MIHKSVVKISNVMEGVMVQECMNMVKVSIGLQPSSFLGMR
jgi:hypothetical protein